MQRTETPETTYLRDYKTPEYFIDKVDLQFELDDKATVVTSHLEVRANPEMKEIENNLILHGQDLKLESISLDGKVLDWTRYIVTDKNLIITNVPEKFSLEIKTTINPEANTLLQGLYKSQGNFTTQCEAEGFRRITYFLDRPDIMAKYTTTIIADQKKYPILLSNGNLIDKGQIGEKHWIKWEDPFKKPSYLYALVAGDFDYIEDFYLTKSGRRITLQIYAEKGYGDRCAHAMQALKKSMKWDEDNYGRECDLDMYKIVAVSDFNAGAMENKGLNIFNAKYILATPETATDSDYLEVEATIGHEYFHNWTGNRITCRDWFQLSLKEGLTTFREQSFVEDISSVASRINDVFTLRNRQFIEDAGPLSHPVQPQSYIEIDNFYTTTVYKKGAEIYRMLQTTLGKDLFRKGMDLYFERHDGQAVTIEDFVKAMEDASKLDLSQFLLWFHQAGTPVIDVEDEYNEEKQTYTLKIKQSCPPTPGQPDKKPLAIPVRMGLLDEKGTSIPLFVNGSKSAVSEKVLLLKQPIEEFHFDHITSKPTPSLLRHFSAPVKLNYAYSDKDLQLLAKHDSDLFNRWDASRKYVSKFLLALIADYQQKKVLNISKEFIDTFHSFLNTKIDDLEILSLMISLPTETELANQMTVVDVDAICAVRKFVSSTLAQEFRSVFHALYDEYNLINTTEKSSSGQVQSKESGKHSMKNICLDYLMKLDDPDIRNLTMQQFMQSLGVNMTDNMAAFNVLMDSESKERTDALEGFYNKWHHDPQVMDFWFEAQAASRAPDNFSNVKKLLEHKDFDIKNPNKLFSLIGPWTRNLTSFHAASGEGYRFLADLILKMDTINSKSAADLVVPFTKWKRYDEGRQKLMCAELHRILQQKGLSTNVYEMVSKSLEIPTVKLEKSDVKDIVATEMKPAPSEISADAAKEDGKAEQKSDIAATMAKAISATSLVEKEKSAFAKTKHQKDAPNPYLKPTLYGLSIVGGAALAAYSIFRLASGSTPKPVGSVLRSFKKM